MTQNDLVSTSTLVNFFGVKAIVYGGPGTGKTPLCISAPNPVICFTEPGFLSVRSYTGPAYQAFTSARIEEFLLWAIQSKEARQFSTFSIDSVSEMAEIVLAEEFAKQASGSNKNADPRNAYGEMAKKVMKWMRWIYFTPNFNALMIAKEIKDDNSIFRPYFPGNVLNIEIPHLFDSVWRIELRKKPDQTLERIIRTKESFNAFARDRSGLLAEIEHADINYLFNKAKP